jgi:Icc protein
MNRSFLLIIALLVISITFGVVVYFRASDTVVPPAASPVATNSATVDAKSASAPVPALTPVLPRAAKIHYPNAKFTFAVLGDTQRFYPSNASGGLQQAVKSIQAKNVDLVMTVGDLLQSCGDGCDDKLEEWQDTLGSLATKTYAVMGNHDRTKKSKSDKAWQKVFDMPTNGPEGYSELVYSFDFQNTHFVVLNTEKSKTSTINQEQRDWLERDLAANTREQTFVFYHQPAYPVSSKIGESLDVYPDKRDALWEMFIKYKVTAVFNGHEHIHSRQKVKGVYQFVFGNTDSFAHEMPKPGAADFSYDGNTYGLVEVAGDQVVVKLYTVDGQLVNTYKLDK